MRVQLYIFAILLMSLFLSGTTFPQQTAAASAAELRAQLAEVQARQTELQNRLQELDEALKPENIQNSLAGIGSVHPEDLREQRRRQLEREKTGVVAQLEKLATSQRRLETAIANADAAAYQQSAQPPGSVKGPNFSDSGATIGRKAPVRRHRSRRARTRRIHPTN